MSNQFGEHIRTLRGERKLLQRQVAAQLEIDTPMLSKIERGERNAKREQVDLFAQIFHVDVNELLTLWLADLIYEVIKDESDATEALRVAEDVYKYEKEQKKK